MGEGTRSQDENALRSSYFVRNKLEQSPPVACCLPVLAYGLVGGQIWGFVCSLRYSLKSGLVRVIERYFVVWR